LTCWQVTKLKKEKIMKCISYKDPDLFSAPLPIQVNLEGDSSTREWLVFEATGEVWLCGQTYSFHPWKDRDYPASEPRRKTLDEAISLIQRDIATWKRREAVEAEKDRKADEYEEYVSSLPPVVGSLRIGGGGAVNVGELSDEYGNFCFSIPRQAAEEGWSLSALEEWVRQEAEEMFYEGGNGAIHTETKLKKGENHGNF
jgi:hypothetical protein